MNSVKEKISNMASSAKEHVKIGKAQIEEKLEKAAANTEEKRLAHERKEAKEARAKMELHQEKVKHIEKKLTAKQPQYIHGYGHDLDHDHDHDPSLIETGETRVPSHRTAPRLPHGHH